MLKKLYEYILSLNKSVLLYIIYIIPAIILDKKNVKELAFSLRCLYLCLKP